MTNLNIRCEVAERRKDKEDREEEREKRSGHKSDDSFTECVHGVFSIFVYRRSISKCIILNTTQAIVEFLSLRFPFSIF